MWDEKIFLNVWNKVFSKNISYALSEIISNLINISLIILKNTIVHKTYNYGYAKETKTVKR